MLIFMPYRGRAHRDELDWIALRDRRLIVQRHREVGSNNIAVLVRIGQHWRCRGLIFGFVRKP
jgi:hypothetical protein